MAWSAYAPGMGTASYCTSPGATGAWGKKFGTGDAGEVGVLRDPAFGVAGLAFLGAGWRLKLLFSAGLEKADGGSTRRLPPGVKGEAVSSMSPRDLYACGGKRGDSAYCEKAGDLGPKPGVLGAV